MDYGGVRGIKLLSELLGTCGSDHGGGVLKCYATVEDAYVVNAS